MGNIGILKRRRIGKDTEGIRREEGDKKNGEDRIKIII
jgi:hypothetical protein